MTDLILKQNDTASEVVTNERANNMTEAKIDAVVKVKKVIDCFSAMHTFWRSCNEKLYEGLSELYGVVKDASDADIKAICTRYKVEYKPLNYIEVIFKATFDSAFNDELNDVHFKDRICDRRKIYKMAIKNMLKQNFTKEKAFEELKNKGVEAVARGKSKEVKIMTSKADVPNNQYISEPLKTTLTCELTEEQKDVLEAVTDRRTKNKLKQDFMILRYENSDVIKANRGDVIKTISEKVDTLRINKKGIKPVTVIVSNDDKTAVGNPLSLKDN